ncbi:MAG: CPBP family intramembrane metalloprotease, partial [Ruminiclostridium sp.]|nr:CPBP family intramembrane metalloprotease [Ruminiclostridium sp.]
TLPKPFFWGFLILTGLAIADCFLTMEISALSDLGSIALGVLLFAAKDDSLRTHNLSGGNWGISLRIFLLFVAIILVNSFLCSALSSGPATALETFLTPALPKTLLMLPVFFLITFPHFLGEEYGWRTYFQPLLQNKFGLIKGVLVFGVLWEFWHLPLVIFYYAPQVSTMSLIQLILYRYVTVTSIAIFMAYAYMKTSNVWLPVFLHCANNNLAVLGGESSGELTWAMLGLFILIRLILFLPILRSKVFQVHPES